MQDLMIDIETLGTKPGAPIIAIGAAYFDPMTGEVGDMFEETIEFKSACAYGDPDASTIKWWLKQSDAAREALVSGTTFLPDAMRGLYDFVKNNHTVRPWGNGATFDISMLEVTFERVGVRVPWRFWNIRDVRTVCQLAEGLIDKNDFQRAGAHKALDDALFQIRYVSAMFQALRAT